MRIVADALSWQGVPYLYGGIDRTGVDCSGFVHEVLVDAEAPGVLPRKSSAFASFGEAVDLSSGDIEPGDILLFGRENTISHVGIALSSDAFIHAASSGPRTGVIISRLEDESWRACLLGARRPGEDGE
jgi:cell wall-associated NlpC family hydrolase